MHCTHIDRSIELLALTKILTHPSTIDPEPTGGCRPELLKRSDRGRALPYAYTSSNRQQP